MTPSLTLSKDYKYKDCIHNLCFKSRLIAVRQCRAVSDWLVWCGTRRRNTIGTAGTAGRIMSPHSRYRAAQRLRRETALLHRLRSLWPLWWMLAKHIIIQPSEGPEKGSTLCAEQTSEHLVLETNSNDWNGQPFGTDAGPYASPCCTKSPLVKRVWGAVSKWTWCLTSTETRRLIRDGEKVGEGPVWRWG